MTNYRLMDGLSGRPGNGPATPSAYTGNYLAGTGFEVTQGGLWFTGFWWWVCNTGQQAAAQKFALWQFTSATTGIVIPGTTVTSGTLTAGQWNYTPVAAPVPLSINTFYQAATGYVSTTGFPETDNQYGAGQPYAAGITNGPLFAYGNAPGIPAQSQFSTAGSDPGVTMPASAFANANFWMDLQVTDVPPAGSSYRLWPNQPFPVAWLGDTPTGNFTLGTEFTLAQSCALNKIWFYSPAGATQLPTECGIWTVPGAALAAGTHLTSPAWSGAAASGWVSVSYAGVSLPAGDYKVTVYNNAGTPSMWNATTFPYWGTNAGTTGPGASGIAAGPLAAPNAATATSPGQSTYNLTSPFTYPATFAAGIGAATYWTDVEVTPAGITVAGGPAAAAASAAQPAASAAARAGPATALAAAPAAGVPGGALFTVGVLTAAATAGATLSARTGTT